MWRQCAPLCNTFFLGPIRDKNLNGISISSAISAQFTAERRYTLQRAALSPLRTAPSHEGIWTPI